MAYPSVNSVLIRGALANVSIGYRNPEYIAQYIYPTIDGLDMQTRVTKHSKWSWFQATDELYRSEHAVAKRYGMQVTTQNLDPKEIANGVPISDELIRASRSPTALPFNPEQSAILNISDRLDRYREKMVADSIFAGTWADGASGGTAPSGGAGAWALDTTGNTFIYDVQTAKQTIAKNSGLEANELAVDYQTFATVIAKDTATGGLVDRMKYTNPAITNEQALAGVLGLRAVRVGKTIYTTEKETGSHAMESPKWIWNQNSKGFAMLYHASPTGPGLMSAFPGYQYRVSYEGGMYREIRTYREEANKHYIYEASENVDVAQMCSDVLYLWKTCISA